MTAKEAKLISQSSILQRISYLAHMGRKKLAVHIINEQEKIILEELGYKISYGKYLNTGIFFDNFVNGFLIEWS